MVKTIFSNPHHMAIVVWDMDKTIEYYQSLGMGPFITAPPVEITKRMEYGRPIAVDKVRIKEVIGNMGAVRLQLIQPVGEESMFQEFLDTRGEGVHHYAFLLDDIEAEEARLSNRDIEILSSVRVRGGGHIIINTAGTGGVLIELVQAQPGWLEKCPPLPSE